MTHLDDRTIRRYLSKSVDTSERVALFDHLSECEECRAALNAAIGDTEVSDVYAWRDIDAEHLPYETLEALVDGWLSLGKRDHAADHLLACSTCRDEFEDLKAYRMTLQSANAMAPEPSSNMSSGIRDVLAGFLSFLSSLSQRRFVFASALAVCTVAAIAFFAVVRMHIASSRTAPGAEIAKALERPASIEADLSAGSIKMPAELSSLMERSDAVRGDDTVAEFTIGSPIATFVSNLTPAFSWSPVNGAVGYDIDVTDANGKQYGASIVGTAWRPINALPPSTTFTWQVVAHKADGSRVAAPAPPSPRARFRTLDAPAVGRLAAIHATYATDELTLGIADAQAGVVGDARAELSAFVAAHRADHAAAKLLAQVKGWR